MSGIAFLGRRGFHPRQSLVVLQGGEVEAKSCPTGLYCRFYSRVGCGKIPVLNTQATVVGVVVERSVPSAVISYQGRGSLLTTDSYLRISQSTSIKGPARFFQRTFTKVAKVAITVASPYLETANLAEISQRIQNGAGSDNSRILTRRHHR